MKRILAIDLGADNQTESVPFLGQSIEIKRVGCGGDPARARELIAAHDGQVDAIALDGLPDGRSGETGMTTCLVTASVTLRSFTGLAPRSQPTRRCRNELRIGCGRSWARRPAGLQGVFVIGWCAALLASPRRPLRDLAGMPIV